MSDSPPLIDQHKLQARRVMAKLSMAALARQASVHQSYIRLLERGKRGGGPATLCALAGALGCDITDLMPDGQPELAKAIREAAAAEKEAEAA